MASSSQTERQRWQSNKLAILEGFAVTEFKPNRAQREFLGILLQEPPRRVQIWFQNYRAQVKRQASLAKPHSLVPAAIAKKPTAAPLDEELFARMTTDLRQAFKRVKGTNWNEMGDKVYEYVAEAIDALEERRDYRRSLAILTNLMLTYVYNAWGAHSNKKKLALFVNSIGEGIKQWARTSIVRNAVDVALVTVAVETTRMFANSLRAQNLEAALHSTLGTLVGAVVLAAKSDVHALEQTGIPGLTGEHADTYRKLAATCVVHAQPHLTQQLVLGTLGQVLPGVGDKRGRAAPVHIAPAPNKKSAKSTARVGKGSDDDDDDDDEDEVAEEEVHNNDPADADADDDESEWPAEKPARVRAAKKRASPAALRKASSKSPEAPRRRVQKQPSIGKMPTFDAVAAPGVAGAAIAAAPHDQYAVFGGGGVGVSRSMWRGQDVTDSVAAGINLPPLSSGLNASRAMSTGRAGAGAAVVTVLNTRSSSGQRFLLGRRESSQNGMSIFGITQEFDDLQEDLHRAVSLVQSRDDILMSNTSNATIHAELQSSGLFPRGEWDFGDLSDHSSTSMAPPAAPLPELSEVIDAFVASM